MADARDRGYLEFSCRYMGSDASRYSPFFQFRRMVEHLSDNGRGGKSAAKMSKILRALDYSGVVDRTGSMASDSPPQLVTFVAPERLFTMPNPLLGASHDQR